MRYFVGVILFLLIAHVPQTNTPAQVDKTTVEYNIDLDTRLKKGDPNAQYEVAMNLLGRPAPRAFNDVTRGQSLLLKAAKQNHAQAQHTIAGFYYLGKEFAKKSNAKEAAKWYLAAANNGHAKSQDFVADWYSRGKVFPLDQVKSTQWYRASAQQGYMHAQVLMGKRSEEGLGMTANNKEAIYWYKLAAAQGNPLSKERLEVLNRQKKPKTRITSKELGEVIGSIIIAAQKAQKTKEKHQQKSEPIIASSPQYQACYSKVNKRIATCGVSMGQCDLGGCGTEVTCDKGWAASSCQYSLQGMEYGEYFCDTETDNNLSKSRKVVIDKICRP